MSKKPTSAIKSSVATRSAVPTPSVPVAQPASQTTPATASPPLLEKGGEKDAALPASATLQQRRALFALTRIQALAGEWKEDAKKQKEFNSYASAMPFMIHANGLGQTAAFYRRKGTDHTYYQLYKLLGDWLRKPDQPFAGKTDLLDGITQSDMDAYLAAQVEAMLFLDWVKKLASAFLAHDEESAP
jgi:CRISPR-associated protein Cmr5